MKKFFLPYDTVRDNAIKLAYRIYKDDFIPDVIYVSLRGGAYLGNVISEFFKILRKDSHPIFYAAVVARSYTDIREQSDVMIDGWTYDPQHLRHGDKVLLVDDIFDSGKTINRLVELIVQQGIPRKDIKIVVHDYKVFTYIKEQFFVQPDYYCRKHLINSQEEDLWIHYMSHELVGLSKKELDKNYNTKDPELAEAFNTILERSKA
jgi:uncharacterized protein